MRTFALLFATAMAAAAAMPSSVCAQTPESERVRITDPELLVRWGYAPDARDVYAKVGYDTATRSDGLGEDDSRGIVDPGPRYWVTATGFSFHPLSNNGEYVKGPSFLVMNGAVVVTGTERVMEAQYDVVDGSYLRYMDIFGFHNQTGQEFVFNTIERCLPFVEAGNPVETVIATTTQTSTGGHFVATQIMAGAGHLIWARECSYHTRVIFGSGGSAPSLNMQLTKVRAELAP